MTVRWLRGGVKYVVARTAELTEIFTYMLCSEPSLAVSGPRTQGGGPTGNLDPDRQFGHTTDRRSHIK